MDVLDQMGNKGHPEEEGLERYVMKTCSEQETETIEEHLLVCEHCQRRLRCAEEWVVLMKSALPRGPRRLKWPRWRLDLKWSGARPVGAPQFGHFLGRPSPVLLAAGAAFAALLCTAPILLREPAGEDQLVALFSTRGSPERVFANASAVNHLILEPDVRGLIGPLEIQVVDSEGAVLFFEPMQPASPRVRLDRKLRPGLYWVRINSAEGAHSNLRESGLTVR